MVTPIEIQILAGRQAGRRLVLHHSPITFGRDEQCDLLIDLPAISRKHGQLEYNTETQQWQLLNESVNGVEIGWSTVRQKPYLLKQSTQISIGGHPILQLTPQTVHEKNVEQTDAQEMEQDAQPSMSGKTKLWVGIASLWGVALLLLMIFGTLGGESDANRSPQGMTVLSAAEIRDEVFSPPPVNPPDARRSAEHRNKAEELFILSRNDTRMLFDAYQEYRLALSLTPDQMFESGLHQRRYQVVQQRLAEELIERYRRATGFYESGQYLSATDAFRSLMQFYPAGRDSRITQNIENHLESARLQAR